MQLCMLLGVTAQRNGLPTGTIRNSQNVMDVFAKRTGWRVGKDDQNGRMLHVGCDGQRANAQVKTYA